MLVAGYFGALLDSQIPGISIYHFIIFSNQRGGLCDIVGICRRDRHGMHKPAVCIHTDVAFHPEFPLISLFRLMYFRVTLLLRIFRGAGGIDDRRIHDGAAFHHVAGLHHYPVDRIKKQLVQSVFSKDGRTCTASFHPALLPS